MVSINNRFGNYNVQVGQIKKQTSLEKTDGNDSKPIKLNRLVGKTETQEVEAYHRYRNKDGKLVFIRTNGNGAKINGKYYTEAQLKDIDDMLDMNGINEPHVWM